MNELQIFNNSEFGEMRTSTMNDETWFCLADICRPLGIQSSDCRKRLKPEGVVSIHTPTKSGMQTMLFVNESNLYKAVFQSKKSEAEQFTDWVTSEVLPAIRKHGTYSVQTISPAELMLQQAKIMVDMEKKITALQAETDSTRRKVDALSDSPAYWRSETDRKIKEIASRNRMAERLFRRDLYAELERVTGYDLENRLTRLRNRAKKQGALHTACNAMTRLDVIAQNKELRQEFGRLLGQYDTQIEWRA